MAARKDSRIRKEHRERIRTSMILNRLNNHILCDKADPEYKNKHMEPSQVNAALGLLRKTLPDLQATEMDLNTNNSRVEQMTDTELLALAERHKAANE